MPTEPKAKPRPKRAAPSLWGLRSTIPAGPARIASAISVLVLIAAWCVVSYVKVDHAGELEPLVKHSILPAPDEVIKSLLYLFFEMDLAKAIAISALRIGVAILLSLLVALPLGIAMGSFEIINRVFEPVVAPMRYLPITAFIPLMILWFGIGEAQKVAFLFLGTVVYLLPAVVDAIRLVPEELVQTAFTLGATKRQVITSVLIKAAMPQIFDGFRVMNAIAWTYIILAEYVNAPDGIGSVFKVAERLSRPDWTFAAILVVGVIGLLTDLLISGLNNLLFSWRETNG
jgi:NitT/TauT family transport system permease protein